MTFILSNFSPLWDSGDEFGLMSFQETNGGILDLLCIHYKIKFLLKIEPQIIGFYLLERALFVETIIKFTGGCARFLRPVIKHEFCLLA